MTDKEYADVWEYTEEPPDYAEAVADLWHWSTNYDAGKGPITLFLDLIGWSEDVLGDTLYHHHNAYGYVELSKLADALKEYTNRPQDVRAWIDGLMEFDGS
jgi:hypothetical protein